MQQRRRDLLAGLGAVGTSLALAGCTSGSGSDDETTDESTNTPESTPADGGGEESDTSGDSGSTDAAVATELTVYRSRLYDAAALARAGEHGRGAAVAQSIFQRFEGATSENGAHEVLEQTSEDAYQGFEGGLDDLQRALDSSDTQGAIEAATTGAGHVRDAQLSLAGEAGTHALDILTFGSRVLNAGALANVGAVGAAGAVAQETLGDFESAAVHEAIEAADEEAYGNFEGPIEEMVSVAEEGDAQGVVDRARASAEAAVDGAYALTTEAMAGAGHVATLQARGFDAAAVAPVGGHGTGYAHAATLNAYRARAYDARWLARRGQTDTAATTVSDTFAHFEGARAHEGLEAADREAYEAFEGGLESLTSATENGDTDGIDNAVETVDSNLVTGIDALAGEHAPVLQAGFFKTRLADARELYRQDEYAQAAAVVSDLFARFEANELGLHETMEETDEALYTRFEEDHLTALGMAYEEGDDDAVATHHEGALTALLEFERAFSPTLASGSGATYMAALAFDAAAVDAQGRTDRAVSLGQTALSYFESGAAGYHEALEEADEALYTRFEDEALGAVISAAQNGSDVYAPAKTFFDAAVDTVYAIVGSGSGSGAATAIAQDVFTTFEEARVHGLLEEADHDAYESFEGALESFIQSGATDPAGFADTARTAQFALLAGADAAPSDMGNGDDGGSEDDESERDPSLSGGPNVVEGVPEKADHVAEMKAVAFEPAKLTVSTGDTVAFTHAAGEAHNVVAYEGGIPESAPYWSSGDFDSEQAARTGWENGEGAVQSGQSYVHTFETTGEHQYFCAPHEMAGMKGTIVVE